MDEKNSAKNIVVAGAGFGGITALLTLESRLRSERGWRLVLIDRNAFHLYTPMLYEIASVPREEAGAAALKSAIVIPIEDITAATSIGFVQAEITALDPKRRVISLADGTKVSYEYLVFALGSATNYFNIPGLEEHAYSLKTFRDAVRIRNRIETLTAEERELTLVVGGAGSAGVELAAEFSNFLCSIGRVQPALASCRWRIVLVEGEHEILPGYDARLADAVRERLGMLAIEIRTSSRIKEVSAERVFFEDGGQLAYDVLVWTGGVRGIALYQSLELPLTKKGALRVNEFLEATDGLFVIGDGAGFIDPQTGKPLPGNAPIAEAQGRRAAKNILRRIRGLPLREFRPWRAYPFILAVGKKYAIADLVILRWHGFLGWTAKLLVEFRYLLFILPVSKALRRWIRGIRVYSSNDR